MDGFDFIKAMKENQVKGILNKFKIIATSANENENE